MQKEYLLLPGPTPLPPQVIEAMTRPMINHRGPTFTKIYEQVVDGLQRIFGTERTPYIIPAAGTGGLEAAVVNCFRPGDKVLAVVGGAFGDRFAKTAVAHGLDVERMEVSWGEALVPQAVAERLRADREGSIRGVLLTHNETSTGVTHPIAEVARLRGDHPALLLVDAISSLGALPLPMDLLGLDVVITGSQKALMCPPGLTILATSARALDRIRESGGPRSYFDLLAYEKGLPKWSTPYTPAVSLWYALAAAVDLILEEGIENTYRRHALLGAMTRAGVKGMGLRLLADHPFASDSVTAVLPPEGMTGDEVRKALRGLGVTVAGGQGGLAGKIFRIGHVGYVAPLDIVTVLSALEMVLRPAGVEPASGVKAAEEVFLGWNG